MGWTFKYIVMNNEWDHQVSYKGEHKNGLSLQTEMRAKKAFKNIYSKNRNILASRKDSLWRENLMV